MIKIYNRQTKKYEEEIQYQERLLVFLYKTKIGRILLKIIILPFVSKLYRKYNNTKTSTKKIKSFIENNKIKKEEFEEKEYQSFNDFFKRKIKLENRPLPKENFLISPADSKLLVYKIEKNLHLNIKNTIYTLNELVNNEIDLSEYKNGYCLIFRLSMDDYHRYCYIESGKIKREGKIKGKLHTISSISKDYKVYKENTREYCIIQTNDNQEMIQIEVGAILVGKIQNNHQSTFIRGEEKGYFELGGSTIIILLKANAVKIDSDILQNSKKEIETKVKYRERIGEKLC